MSTDTAPAPAPDLSGQDAPTRRRRRGRSWSPGWFVVPFLVFFLLFMIWPILYGAWLSLTDESLVGDAPSFVGLANYAEALGDPDAWSSLGNTLFFVLISTVPLVVVALVMAITVYTGVRGQWLWRLAFFAPYLLPVATVAMIWSWLFEENLGLVNQTLTSLGLAPIGWISEEGAAMWAVTIATVWWTVGFNFLLYLSALQAIPHHLYEAAALDGAGPLRRLWNITIPQLSRITGVVLTLQILSSLKVFDQIYLMTKGGPNGATRSMLLYVYDIGFTGYRIGYGAALSYLFLALIVIVSIIQVRLARQRGNSA
ncbi:carbohydrate ABC transporter permease [Georgenia deserti]|uniref:Carbohydrate ABC transporter permease n=1 Tax=Georgenia deserti TaxID=2093781 RepID=A0ABW4L801_9MICO